MLRGVLVELTNELWDAIDAVRGDQSRSAWIEDVSRRQRAIRDLRVEFADRPTVGRYARTRRRAAKARDA